jgi:O-antigen ligase
VKQNIHSNIALGTLVIAAATMPFSIRLCHLSLLVFVLNWAAIGSWRQKVNLMLGQKHWWIMPLYFLVCLAGVLHADNSSLAWQQIEKKAAFLLLPITVASSPLLERKHLRWIMRTFLFACFTATLFSLAHAGWIASGDVATNNFNVETLNAFNHLHPNSSPVWMAFSYVSLASGAGLHPTYFGLYLVVCLLIMLYFFRSEEMNSFEKRLYNALLIYFFVFIVFLSSRITILAGAGVLLSAIDFRGSVSSADKKKVRWIALVLAVVILYVNPVSRFRGLQEPFVASMNDLPRHATSSIDIRRSLLQLSSFATNDANPFVGSGTGSAEQRLRTEGNAHGLTNVLGSYDPHNQYLYTFLEQGFMGLVVLLTMLVLPLYSSIQMGSRLYAGILLVFATVCLTESALELQKGIVLFAFFGSLLLFHETAKVKHRYG